MKSLCWLHFHSWLAELSRYLDSYREKKRCMWRKNASHEGLHAYSHFQESLERFLVFLQERPGLNYIIDSFTNSSLFVMYLYSIHLLVAYILMIGYFSSFRESFRAFSRLKKDILPLSDMWYRRPFGNHKTCQHSVSMYLLRGDADECTLLGHDTWKHEA